MAAIVNDRDLRLQATSPRFGGAGQGVILTGSTSAFYERADGSRTPNSVSLEAVQLGIPSDVTWSITGGALAGTGATRTLDTSTITGESAVITAKVTTGGTEYTSSFTVFRLRDGADGAGTPGARGAGHYYAAGAVWSDAVADAATPGGNVIGDVVTISDSVAYVMEKKWDGDSWELMGTVIDGNLLVSGTVKAGAIGVSSVSAISANLGTFTSGTTGNQTIISGPAITITNNGAVRVKIGQH